MGSDKTRQQQLINLRRDFENLKMKESESIRQYSDRIMATVNIIRLLGEDFSNSRVVEKVIATMPERFESKISSLEDSRNLTTVSLSELVNSLYALEQRRAKRQEEHLEGAFQANGKESLVQVKKGRSLGSIRGRNQPDIQCRSCKQFGHVEKEEHIFTASCYAIKSKDKYNWLVDSGCSHHMSADESLFKDLDKSYGSKIRIGNGDLIEAKGKGNVVINTSSDSYGQEMITIGMLGKQARLPFPVNQAWRARERLELVQSDKSEVFDTFNRFKALVENQSGCKIKALRTDNCGEYLSERFQKLFYLLNKLPTRAVKDRTPFEAWYGLKPSVSHLKVLGCVCYALIPVERRSKLEKGSDASQFDEDQFNISLEPAESEPENANIDDPLVRGTRTIADIYHRWNTAIVEPSNYEEGARDRCWKKAMEAELDMIHKNKTWDLVDRPDQKKVIGVKWVFRAKFNTDGSLNKHKARLVVKGYNQQYGSDFMETFTPVARLDTIKLLFALAAQKQWKIHQLDVKSAFLNGFLKEEIYIEQPDGFKVSKKEGKVYRLKKALYGLKQAPRAWYDRIDEYLSRLRFEKSLSEPTLYVKKAEDVTLLIVSIYVDDLLVTGSKTDLINDFKILNKFCMINCKVVSTPLAQGEKLISFRSEERVDENEYRSQIGCLLYLTATRPDLMHAVSLLSRVMHCCDTSYFKAAKRVLRYVKGTLKLGVMFKKENELRLIGYSDSDWTGSLDDMKSTSGYFFTLGSGVFCWSSKKQQTVAQSTAEVEYIAAATAVNQAIWLRKLLFDLNEDQSEATEIMVDNQSVVAIAKIQSLMARLSILKSNFILLERMSRQENPRRSIEHWPAMQHVTSSLASNRAME
ncbi:hypothetical protein CXB51_024610 [Gossypium anomalum]|uniref:Reverse transcriptase Ty1/copia-type domain-containing protein n=1 Tax=Gossypium anomalum TaxID=47600 RepID=A0A8J5YDN0_9ROSI|nr:hypothetical protein CXB51_024610 [Gossypium anomalum]